MVLSLVVLVGAAGCTGGAWDGAGCARGAGDGCGTGGYPSTIFIGLPNPII